MNSRSAAAVDKLEKAGYQNIACITSGLQSVKPGNQTFKIHICLVVLKVDVAKA